MLVTDGQSNVQPHLTIPKANELKRMGVDIYVIAVGRYFDGMEEIKNIFSRTLGTYFYRASDMWEMINLVLKEIAPGTGANVHDPSC